MTHYILNEDNIVVPTEDVMEWARFFEQTARRIVKQETWGPFYVSTVFLGVDHGYDPNGPPVVFETMTFLRWPVDISEVDMNRCSTWAEAWALHRAAMRDVKKPRVWWKVIKMIPEAVGSQYRLINGPYGETLGRRMKWARFYRMLNRFSGRVRSACAWVRSLPGSFGL